jgi:hypothetical protein
MARPKKHPEETRTERLSGLRLTMGERLEIETKAAQLGLSVMEYQRRTALGLRIRPRRPSADDRLLSELNDLGVNLNQITRKMHMTGQLPPGLPELVDRIRDAIDKVVVRS